MTRLPIPLLVAGVVFALDVLFMAPGVTWLDGGEFVATVGPLGVSHPPGQPAYMVLGALATLLPVGELSFRLALLSGACSAGAAGLLAWSVARAADSIWPEGDTGALAGLAAGLLLGVSPALSMQAVRPELYALTLLLGLAAVAAVQLGGRRGLSLAVVPLCVAGAVHHAMLVAAIPGLVIWAVGRGRRAILASLVTAAALLPFGLGQFAWLPLRSAALPPFDFGAPRTLDRVVHAVTGAGYARSFRIDGAQLARNAGEHLAVALQDVGPLALILAAAAVVALLRSRRFLLLGAATAVVLVGAAPTALQGIFSPDNPDAHGYLLGPIAVLCAGGGLGVCRITAAARARSALAPWLAAALVLGALSSPLLRTARMADHRGLLAPRVLGAAVLDGSPPGAVLLLGGDSWLFPTLAARVHERRRPDVHVVGLHMLEPVLLADARARGVPLPAAEVDGEPPSGLMAEHLLRAVLAAQPTAPLLVNDFFLPPEILALRRPSGLLHQIGGPVGAASDEDAVIGALDDVLGGAGWARDGTGQQVMARRHMARGGYHLQRGERDLALALFTRGSAATMDPWAMVHLARYRLETSADGVGPWPADAQVAEAAERMMVGELEAATALVDAVLRQQPTHPGALLLSERLYSLGHYAATEAAAP